MLQLEARPKAIWPDFLVVMCVAQADAGNGRTGSCHYEAAPAPVRVKLKRAERLPPTGSA
jgi:hypothetical protein